MRLPRQGSGRPWRKDAVDVPKVVTDIELQGVSQAEAWRVVEDFEAYPRVMKEVVEVRVLERSGLAATSSWRVLLNGSELTWVERDVFDPPCHIAFDQIEGDLETFRGEWTLRATASGVRVLLAVEFDIGIPSLAAVLDPIGIQAITTNSRAMLRAIRHETGVNGWETA